MIKSAIFDIKQVVMQCPLFISFIIWVLVSANVTAQYTETINTNRPGTSQGAFSVGKNVVQFETGLVLGSERHDLFNNKTNTSEFQYNIRVGLLKEQLEFGLEGSYLRLNSDDRIGNDSGITRKGFPFNALGVKYLIYDPYKFKRERSANILSWNANRKFQWKKLIPAVSAYAAANFTSSTGDLSFQNNPDNRATEVQPNITPKFVISAHNVWSERLVFIANLVSRNLGSEFPEIRFITTTTYNYNSFLSFFGEYEAVSSKVYKDHLLKAGGAFLLTKDLQFDMRILGNFKNTPSIFNVAFGASYRLDYHKNTDNEYIDTGENYDAKKYVALIKKDIESGHLDKSVLTGELQSVIDEDVIIERFSGVDLESFAQEEEEEEEFDEEFDEDIEEEDTRIRWWQIGKKRRLRKKAFSDTLSTKSLAGTGGRRSDFLDDDFIKQKQAEITPAERTAEELAELEFRREEEENKKKKRLFGKNSKANEIYVDKITGDSIPPPDYSSMSKKERKIAEKRHKELFELDELGLEDLDLEGFADSIEEEQNTRDVEKARKKKEKAARKLAKKEKKRNKKDAFLYENEDDEPAFEGEEIKDPNPVIQNKLPEENFNESDEEEFDLEKALKEDKELQKLEAEIAREEEKERKRLEKEAAKNAKLEAELEKRNARQSEEKTKESQKQLEQEKKRLEENKLAKEKAAQLKEEKSRNEGNAKELKRLKEEQLAEEIKLKETARNKQVEEEKQREKEEALKRAAQQRLEEENKRAQLRKEAEQQRNIKEASKKQAKLEAEKQKTLEERNKKKQKEAKLEAEKALKAERDGKQKEAAVIKKSKTTKTSKKKKKSKFDEIEDEEEEEF